MFRLAIGTVLVLALASVAPTSSLAAQTPATEVVITTSGSGLASTPAERMILQLVIVPEDQYGAPPTAPVVEATPGASARAATDPIVAAIKAHGGVESVETIVPAPIGNYGRPPSTARLDVQITAPTQDSLVAIVNDAARAAGAERLIVGYIGAWFEVSDCAALETDARQTALDDAVANATIQADVMGVALGAAIAATDVTTTTSPQTGYYGATTSVANSCSDPQLTMSLSEFGVIGPAFDPVTQEPNVEVLRTIDVTFAVSGS